VGIYRREGETLVLDAWDGPAPTEHTRIPVDRGVCGRAVREQRTVIVDDVRSAPDYLACFLETRAEIVVPIRDGSTVVGEIDIDGNEPPDSGVQPCPLVVLWQFSFLNGGSVQ
jgi:GAF domain-containing protein